MRGKAHRRDCLRDDVNFHHSAILTVRLDFHLHFTRPAQVCLRLIEMAQSFASTNEKWIAGEAIQYPRWRAVVLVGMRQAILKCAKGVSIIIGNHSSTGRRASTIDGWMRKNGFRPLREERRRKRKESQYTRPHFQYISLIHRHSSV